MMTLHTFQLTGALLTLFALAAMVAGLGVGLAFAEAVAAQEARVMAYVQNHLNDGIRSTRLAGAETGIVPGPLRWAAFKSKFFVLVV